MNYPQGQSSQSARNSQNGLNNYSQAFNTNPQLINKQNFTNKNSLLHNNVADRVDYQEIIEYEIYINSLDRNINIYANPFHFTTIFGGIGTSINEQHVYDPVTNTYNFVKHVSNGTATPTIDRTFDNIKYVNIDQVILPRSNVFTIDNTTNPPTYKIDSPCKNDLIKRHRFLTLKVKELGISRIFSTGPSMTDKSFLLVPDKDTAAGNGHIWKIYNNARVFPATALGNIQRLTTVLCDEFGQEITPILKTKLTPEIPAVSPNPAIPATYSYTPYNISADIIKGINSPSLIKLNTYMQVFYSITLGKLEIEMNTLPNFSR